MNFEQMRQKEIALGVGVTVKSIQRWTSDGMPRNEDDSYSLPRVGEWLVDRAKDEVSSTDTDSDRWLGQYRKERALIARMEREQLEKKLGPIDVFEREFTERAYELTRRLMLLSRRISHKVAGKSKRALKDVSTVIDDEVHAMLEEYSRPITVEYEPRRK